MSQQNQYASQSYLVLQSSLASLQTIANILREMTAVLRAGFTQLITVVTESGRLTVQSILAKTASGQSLAQTTATVFGKGSYKATDAYSGIKTAFEAAMKAAQGSLTAIPGALNILNNKEPITPKFGEDLSESLNNIFSGGNGAMGKWGAMKSMGNSMANIPSAVPASLTKMFAMLGPQMLMLSIVMKPVQALLDGFLAPLEVFSEIFGGFGEVLSILLLPVLDALVPLFTALIPPLLNIVMILQPIIAIMVNLWVNFSAFGLVLNLIVIALTILNPILQLFGVFMQALMPIFSLLNVFGTFITPLADGLARLIEKGIQPAYEWIGKLADQITAFVDRIKGGVDAISGSIMGERSDDGLTAVGRWWNNVWS